MNTQKAIIAFTFLALCGGVARSASALSCGQTVTKADGPQVMTADLTCSGSFALTLDSVSLDMAGHTIGGTATDGIILIGSGSSVANGVVRDNSGNGIVLNGEGAHKLSNLVLQAQGTGIGGAASGNKLTNIYVSAPTSYGLNLSGEGNKMVNVNVNVASFFGAIRGIVLAGDRQSLKDSAVLGYSGESDQTVILASSSKATNVEVVDGGEFEMGTGNKVSKVHLAGATPAIVAEGNGNKLSSIVSIAAGGINLYGPTSNKVTKSAIIGCSNNGIRSDLVGTSASKNVVAFCGDNGIEVNDSAYKNKIKTNFTIGNNGSGIVVQNGAIDNSIAKNTSFGNTDFDLQEDTAGCDNTWSGNLANTRNDACID